MQQTPLFTQRYNKYCNYIENSKEIADIKDEIYFNETYIEYYMEKVTNILIDHNYIENGEPTLKGVVAR